MALFRFCTEKKTTKKNNNNNNNKKKNPKNCGLEVKQFRFHTRNLIRLEVTQFRFHTKTLTLSPAVPPPHKEYSVT